MATLAIQSQGIVFKIGAVVVGEVTNFDGPGGNATIIDATHLASTAKEKLMGLPDEGQFTFDLNLVPENVGQVALRDARIARTLQSFTLILTDTGTTTLTFSGYVLGFSISGGVDDKVNASCTVEITGAVTWA